MKKDMPTFSNPQYTEDKLANLWHVSMSVDGVEDKAKGVGDTKFQAKRNACAKYMHDHEINYLGIPDDE